MQLKRRHDLIPNLVNTVKGAMQFERETLEAVVSARNKAIEVQPAPARVVGKVQQTAAAETQLTGALGRLLAVVEAYPDLKATGNVAQLQEELTSTENKIAFARQLYNDTATQYNTKQQQFPTSLVAGMAGARRRSCGRSPTWPSGRCLTLNSRSDLSIRTAKDSEREGGKSPFGLRRPHESVRAAGSESPALARLVIGFIVFFAWLGFGGDWILYELHQAARRLTPTSRLPVVRASSCRSIAGRLADARGRPAPSACCGPPVRARSSRSGDAARTQLVNVVEEMAVAAGTASTQDLAHSRPDPTRSRPARREHAHIAVTQGLLDLRARDELQARDRARDGAREEPGRAADDELAALVGAVTLMSDGWAAMFYGGMRSARWAAEAGAAAGRDDKGGGGGAS